MYLYDEIDQRMVDERVRQFRGQTQRFLAGELGEEQFRPLRLRQLPPQRPVRARGGTRGPGGFQRRLPGIGGTATAAFQAQGRMNLAIPLERSDMALIRLEFGGVPQRLALPHGRVVVAIDGLKRAGFEYQAFKEMRAAFLAANPPGSATDVTFVPVSSHHGDMILRRGNHIDWYDGPTLAEALGV